MLRTISFYHLCALLFLIYPVKLFAAGDPISIKNRMIITHSVTVKNATYKFNGRHLADEGVIEIKGDNIVVDFNGAVLQGSNDKTRPNEFYGAAIIINGGSNITIKNAVIKGYKFAITVRGVRNLTIQHCDLSYNYRQHLNSNREREDLSDWQSYHHNEKDQWMRFGAAAYLRDCDSLMIKDNVITNGQCALMMTNCNNGIIYNNNFSFNSGIGIGLYRSSYNKIMNNKVDWNVRGVSYGVYYRGQDAAAILVYEQSSHNIFAYNSATHSGDGFFLWAGESTMQSGEGGCNDNLIYGNDFSYAPTNGVEVTFSQNQIVKNKMYDCDYGVWGGYSHNTLISDNIFKNNNTGIAIEQGNENNIISNSFTGEKTGINLWATPGRAANGNGYDRKADIRSRDYQIKNNSFSGLQTVLAISHSEKISIENNQVNNSNEFIRLDSSASGILIRNNKEGNALPANKAGSANLAPAKIEDAKDAMLPENYYSGKQYIMMTEWGPYDFQSPILWLTKTDSDGKMYFDILGPQGKWKVKNVKGADNFSEESGTVPGKLTVQNKNSETIEINLEYTGDEIISPFGKKYSAGTPYIFKYEKEFLPVSWNVELFSFDKSTDPVKNTIAFKKMIETSAPVAQTKTSELNNSYWNGSKIKLPESRTVTIATGTINFPKGKYVIGVSAGDIARVYVDNKMVIDAWNPKMLINDADYHHETTMTLKGNHTIRVEQAQYGGYGILYLTIKPAEIFNY